MIISPPIKAPLAVQLYRCFFTGCVIYFGSLFWEFRHGGSIAGLSLMASFPICSFLALTFTCVHVPFSRWILSGVGIVIPGAVSLGLFASSHREWPDWLFSPFFFFIWLAMPICGAIVLFKDKKTNEYFTRSMA